MQKGKVGRTESGFRSVEAYADEGMEFAAYVNDSHQESTASSIVLSGRAIDRRPRGMVGRIKQSHIMDWLHKLNDDGSLLVAEDVIVDLGDGNYLCGPNGGQLWERPKET